MMPQQLITSLCFSLHVDLKLFANFSGVLLLTSSFSGFAAVENVRLHVHSPGHVIVRLFTQRSFHVGLHSGRQTVLLF